LGERIVVFYLRNLRKIAENGVNLQEWRSMTTRQIFRNMSSQSRQQHITSSLSSVLSTVKSVSSSSVRLVAVSKYIPPEDIQCAYSAGQRHFGENYIQELIQKAGTLPDDIKWHFIGSLQSNKCKMLVEKVKNLWCVETVDSEKKARLLESGAASIERKELLKVFIQVNTSGEERMPI
jgi:PLP dependent protein